MQLNEANIKLAFAIVLKKVRKNKRTSQSNLARAINLDRAYISLLERGLRGPSLQTVMVISEGLGIRAQSLVEMVDVEMGKNHYLIE